MSDKTNDVKDLLKQIDEASVIPSGSKESVKKIVLKLLDTVGVVYQLSPVFKAGQVIRFKANGNLWFLWSDKKSAAQIRREGNFSLGETSGRGEVTLSNVITNISSYNTWHQNSWEVYAESFAAFMTMHPDYQYSGKVVDLLQQNIS
jgi:hypothetical protein